MSNQPLYSVAAGTNAAVIADILRVLFPDAQTALDMTFGNGRFWSPKHPIPITVTGMDLDPQRARDMIGDFRSPETADGSFDVVILDPPYQWDMGKGKPSIMGGRFGTYRSEAEARASIQAGTREAWRTARLGVIVKVQDYIHSQRAQWLSRWVWDALPVEPYDSVILTKRQKITDPKWTRQLSVWRTHATFWIYRKDGALHLARRAAS